VAKDGSFTVDRDSGQQKRDHPSRTNDQESDDDRSNHSSSGTQIVALVYAATHAEIDLSRFAKTRESRRLV